MTMQHANHTAPDDEQRSYTPHCRRRAAERGITLEQIASVLARPEVTYVQTTYGPDRQIRQRGDLAVVVNQAARTVITVLFRDQAEWTGRSSLRPGGTPPVPRARRRQTRRPPRDRRGTRVFVESVRSATLC